MRLDYLDNIDKKGFEAKDGVPVEGILYGGRDSDTTVPIEESPQLERRHSDESGYARIGNDPAPRSAPRACANPARWPTWTSSPTAWEYTLNNIIVRRRREEDPEDLQHELFMLDENGHYTTSKLAKKVWLHWADGRINGEFDAYDTPTAKSRNTKIWRQCLRSI
jgi:phosphoenolpyruvate carboxykinase (GTP)